MFYEIQPGHHINLNDVTYFYLSESDLYRNCIMIYFRGVKEYTYFRYSDYHSCQKAYERLTHRLYSMNNPHHIKAIMD